jgi:hypothetical protein
MSSMRFKARLDTPHPFKVAGAAADRLTLSTGAAYTRVFSCSHRYKSRGFKSVVERGGHAVGPSSTGLSVMIEVTESVSHSRAKMNVKTVFSPL